MDSFIDYLKNNPAIIAALITALCGIVGIFINIGINIHFRNQDYRNKNRITNIEILEEYYVILIEKLLEVERIINKFENANSFKHIFVDCKDAKYDSDKKNLNTAITEVLIFSRTYSSKYAGDYKLYTLQKDIVETISVAGNKNLDVSVTTKDLDFFKNNLFKLVERVEYIKIKLFFNNWITRCYYIFLDSYKKHRNKK